MLTRLAYRATTTAALLLALGSTHVAAAADFSLSSPELQPGQTLPAAQVFQGFGCTGGNQSPALTWAHAPAGTKSYALTVYDPDAPTGSGWWHWVVYNLPASTNQLPSGAGSADGKQLPAGTVQGRTDFGTQGYGGACPPPGHPAHRYQFTVHALDVEKLELPKDATAALIGYMVNSHRLGSAGFQVMYGR